MQLWKYIKEAMLKTPGQIVCENSAEMSYEALVIFAELFSQKLVGEKCCAILCGSEMAAAMSLLSCFAAGVTVVPLSVRYGELHWKEILDMVGPTALITDHEGELQVIYLSDGTYTEPKDHPALLMCTSGTTGKPKGVMLSEKNIRTNIKDIVAYLDIGKEDTMLIARPLYHCAVLTGEFLTALVKGCKIRFYSQAFQPKGLLDLIAEKKITVFCGTPTMLSMMARFQRRGNATSLRCISISGECMSAEVGKRIAQAFPDANIYHVYGLTEACPRVTYLPPEQFSMHPDSVGIPLKSVSVKIVKKNGKPAMCGEEGLLWVRGKNVMLGYYKNPKQTAKVLRDGWLCTGDIAVIDAAGLLKIKGRSDDMIIRAGMNIYPQEIENALKQDARVREAHVYGFRNPHGNVELGMRIAGTFSDSDEVKQLCIESLPAFQVPSVIELLDELPKNAAGKIARRRE